MALNSDDVQSFLGNTDARRDWGERSPFGSDSGHVGRVWIDGVLVVYDLMDVPMWLATVLEAQDEDGNTKLDEPRQAIA